MKNDGKISAVASSGMVILWDVKEGISAVDKYLSENTDKAVQAANK